MSRIQRRLSLVEEHIRQENNRNLNGILATFGEGALYEDATLGERYDGLAGVRSFYEALISALPDLHIAVHRQHVAEETIVLEVTISGTQRGTWRGLPATGRRVAFPLCAVYTFTDEDKLAGERIYYDQATVLHQLGVFHQPTSTLGRLTTALVHPVTLARAYGRRLVSSRRS